MREVFAAVFLVIVNCSFVQAQTPAQDKHFLWKVSSDQSVVYLMGSIHLGKPDMYPLPEVIETAFDQSSALVLEVDVLGLDPTAAQSAMMQKGRYADGGSIKDRISSQTFQMLTGRLSEFRLPLEQVMQFKPWLLAMSLSVMQIKTLGFDENYGVDYYFSRKASGAGKEILQLESLEKQVDFLDSIEDQDKFLFYTLVSMNETEKMLTEILKAWQHGDAAGMEKMAITDILNKYPDMETILDDLLFNRNQDMSGQIKEFINSGQNYFVVVGSAHLIGAKGIVELLRSEGFVVEQL